MKRSQLLLVVILVAVAALVTLLWVGEGPLWRWVMLKRVHADLGNGQWVISFEKRWPHHGKRHGPHLNYHPNGVLFTKGQYDNDDRVGIWTEWERDGRLMYQERFIADRIVETRETPPWWNVPAMWKKE